MKQITIKLYQFDELSDDAKHMVCSKERESTYNYGVLAQETDAEERYATLDAFCKLFGITYRIDYDHQYRFIHWNFEDVDMNGYDWDDTDITGKYLLRYLNRYYSDITKLKYYSTHGYYDEKNQYHYKYRYSRFQREFGCCPFTGMCYDEDILQPIYKWLSKPNWHITLHDLFDDCFSTFMQSWENEDDFRMSDEGIGEMIAINREDALYLENGDEFTGCVEELESYVA